MTDKKRNVIAFSALAAVACVGIVSAIPLTLSTLNPSKADETENAIIFNSGKNVITTTGGIVTSEKSAIFTVSSNGVVATDNKWQTVNANGYFYTASDDSTDKNAIHDMKTITFNFDSVDLPFTIYFSRDGSFEDGHCWSRSYTTITGGQTINFEGHPRYFKFVAGSSAITIDNMKIEYGCDADADTTWDNNHGVNPVISGGTVTYGLYPQTHVSDATLISALSTKATELGVADEEFFWYNDEYYVKDTGNPRDSSYTFSDGTVVVEGTSYFFKCEPIKWNIVVNNETENYYLVDCSSIIYAGTFGSTTTYTDSTLIKWLTPHPSYSGSGTFYYKALSKCQDCIIDYPITTDRNVKVWTGTKSNYTSDWYSDADSRKKKPSDFALCNKAHMDTNSRCGQYWTQTKGYTYNTIYCINVNGNATSTNITYTNGYTASLKIDKTKI